MTYKEAAEIIRINLEGLMASPKVTLDPRLIEAERMAIKTLEDKEKKTLGDYTLKEALEECTSHHKCADGCKFASKPLGCKLDCYPPHWDI